MWLSSVSGRSSLIVALLWQLVGSAYSQETPQALNVADEFSQGVRAFSAGQTSSAQQIWERLLVQYPQRPELLNNLAVLFNRNGDREQAFYFLARAVKSQPSYASVANNWRKFNFAETEALELSLVQEWPRSGSLVSLLPAAPVPAVQPSPFRALLDEAIKAEDQRLAEMAAQRTAEKPSAAVPAKPSLSSELAAQEARALLDAGLELALKQWTASWKSRDVDKYLKWYAPAFKPNDGLSREQWEKQRRTRLLAAQQIELQVRVVKAEPGPLPDSQWVHVIQHYRSRLYQDVSSKSMLWRKSSEGWLILRELTGPPAFTD